MSVTEPLEPLDLPGAVPYPEHTAWKYRHAGWWTDQTHAEMLFSAVAQWPERIAMIDPRSTTDLGEHIGYRQLGTAVLRAAAGIRRRGIGRGDRVVLHLPNGPAYLILFFALCELGAIPVLTVAAHRDHEIRQAAQLSGASACITSDSSVGSTASDLSDVLRSPQARIVFDSQGAGQQWEKLVSGPTLLHRRRCLPSDVAFLQLSGGTTGEPKMVAHTHESYLCSVRFSAEIGGITEETVQLVVLPMAHSFPMRSPGFLGVLSKGGTVVLATDGSPDTAFPLVERYGVTDVSLVPPLVMAWLNSALRETADLSSLKVVRSGGAALGEAAALRIQPELGATLQQSFGMSEGLTTFTPLEEPVESVATGAAAPLTPADEVEVVDDGGRPVRPGTAGHLRTRGPATIRGYFGSPELNRECFTADGYYLTGDIVVQDEAGRLRVVGRSKDQINRGGEKISPQEVENLLVGHPAVHDASVTGIPDRVLGERSKATVVMSSGQGEQALTLAQVREYLRGRGLAGYKMPDALEVVDQLETTAVGKVSKRGR